MLVCFGGVVVIATQRANSDTDIDIVDSNSELKQISSLAVYALVMTSSWTGAIQAVLNRVLKETPATVIIFYHGLFGLILVSTYIMIEAGITGEGFRLLGYTARQYGILMACCLCNSS